MTAAYRLRGIGWFAGCTAIVLGFYLVSLQVASERKRLEHLNADIASTQRDIRALETEFDTRSNLAQLERWNGDTLALSAPVPGQFLHDAAELASVAVIRGGDAPSVRTAALIVPNYAAPSAVPTPRTIPAAVTVAAAVARREPDRAVRVAAVRQPERVAAEEAGRSPVVRSAVVRSPIGRPALSRVAFETIAEPAGHAVAGQVRSQVALLDRKLLSDSTLRDLLGGARAEGGKLR